MIVAEGRNSGAVKWSPAHAEAIDTGNGGRCRVMASKLSKLRILYFPQCRHHPPAPAFTQIHTSQPTSPPGPWRLECDINQSVATTSSTTPDPHGSFLFRRAPHGATATLTLPVVGTPLKEGQTQGLSELRRCEVLPL